MYDKIFVEAICRRFAQEGQRESADAKNLLDLLEAVVMDDLPQIKQELTAIITREEVTLSKDN